VTGPEPAPRSPTIADSAPVALAILLGCGALYAAIARLVLDAFPYSGDEYSIYLQAELFARGLLKARAPEHAAWLRVDHVIIDDWVHSKYPPGAPALLALGMRAGVAWLVTPLEGLVTLAVVWLTTRRILGAGPALIALLTLGLAPLFAFQAASFYTHTATTLFLAVAFAGVANWLVTANTGWLWAVGAAVGCAFLVRPLDAALFGVAMLALRSVRAVAVTAAGALPFVVLHFIYQKLQFGSPWVDGYRLYHRTFADIYGPTAALNPILFRHIWNPVQLWNHLDIYRSYVVEWTLPGTALVALFGAFAIAPEHPARRMRDFSLVLVAVFVLALLPSIADGDDGARPRYLSSTLIPVAFLSAAGFGPACAGLAERFGTRIRTIVTVTVLVFGLTQLSAFLVHRIPMVWRREGLYRVVERTGVSDAVVIVRAKYPTRYARNGALFERDVLYLSAPSTTDGAVVAAAYPGRAVWEAREGEPWTLTRLR
jgi:dolichyl-phosphate-mannose-protein mannosyltransferase